ncbi:MAG: transketolase [Puniceicoccales bacterium]|jgi:transketolase|nr:transketolase [Puniceicoccales bacterium]
MKEAYDPALQLTANASRALVVDMVATAKSGHLGTALGLAELGAALWGHLLHYNPLEPRWLHRDRLVLSAGHASAWLYAWLHLAGFDVTLTDLRTFRQKDSKTPGHPEFGLTPGVECSTGPLGQGIGNAVGLAISAKKLAAKFNTSSCGIFDHKVVCICGDGCMQEGVSSEACSLAGLWNLNNLLLIYDANGVTLDGPLGCSQNEDIVKRFEAYGFDVQEIDGHDMTAIIQAYRQAVQSTHKPQLIVAHTTIGRGIAAIEGSSKAHGESGIAYAGELRAQLGLPEDEFSVPQAVRNFFEKHRRRQIEVYDQWQAKFEAWGYDFPERAEGLKILMSQKKSPIPFDIKDMPSMTYEATRNASAKVLQYVAERDNSLIAGSADLFSSCKNRIDGSENFSAQNPLGRNMAFGVREHAMGSIMNGIAYDGFLRPLGSTFLVFSDYMRPAIRMAAMAHLPLIYIFTHDSIMVGQDGPTHQPVEQLASLRCIPNLDVIRPADAEETIGAWQAVLERRDGPTALIFSRQDLPLLESIPSRWRRQGVLQGAYIAKQENTDLRGIILASGSELQYALELGMKYADIRVVSMPCMERFERLGRKEKEKILPPSCKRRVAIEASCSQSWYRYVGLEGRVMGIDTFGFSASADDLQKYFAIGAAPLEAVLLKTI